MEEGTLFVLGNLLLDVVVPVPDSYLKSHNLQPDSIQAAEEKHSIIFKDVTKRSDATRTPGGSALNTVRMAQVISQVSNAITLVGAVGSDSTGRLLISTVEKEGIRLITQIVDEKWTGQCISLLTSGGSARTMITDMGAALKFSNDKFIKDEFALEWLSKAKFVYISGYFLKVSLATVMEVVKRAKVHQTPVLFNVNAVWLTTSCTTELINVLPYIDIVFGNESEITSLGEKLKLFTADDLPDIFKIAKDLSNFQSGKKVIVTRGEQGVILADSGTVKEYPVEKMAKDEIVDSTGAGDAFVGGFLSQFIQGKAMDNCIRCGIWAATVELRGYGFVLPSCENLREMKF